MTDPNLQRDAMLGRMAAASTIQPTVVTLEKKPQRVSSSMFKNDRLGLQYQAHMDYIIRSRMLVLMNERPELRPILEPELQRIADQFGYIYDPNTNDWKKRT